MSHSLIQSIEPDKTLPLHIVVIAEWYDISPSIKDETVVLVIREEQDPRIDAVMACLLSNRDDYDWKLLTEQETDAHVIGIVQEYEGKVKVFHHIAAAYITTEHLKDLLQEVLKDPT